MDAMELKIHRENTIAFIAAKVSLISLIPISSRVRTPGGGWTVTDGTPRLPQPMRIIELGTNVSRPEITGQDGKQRMADFWLLAQHGAAMAVGDHWIAEDGRSWEVGDIVRDNGYEVRGLVAERGR